MSDSIRWQPRLRWTTHVLPSCLHMARQGGSESQFGADAALALRELNSYVALLSNASIVWNRAIGHAIALDVIDESASHLEASPGSPAVSVRSIGTRLMASGTLAEEQAAEFSERLAIAVGAIDSRLPQLANELPARVRPLREQWEARGPGFLRALLEQPTVRTHIDPQRLPGDITVGLLHPWRGGYGEAHLADTAVSIEGLLYHADPRVPEPLRLGWLVAQVMAALAPSADAMRGNALPIDAMLAEVMQAARAVDWLGADVTPEHVRRSLMIESRPQG
ncbi:MAG: hypothetical protein KDB14_08945 [Planctomycetales bacterium]|nr:hypothetical protein [Planctomycetales bacterium]